MPLLDIDPKKYKAPPLRPTGNPRFFRGYTDDFYEDFFEVDKFNPSIPHSTLEWQEFFFATNKRAKAIDRSLDRQLQTCEGRLKEHVKLWESFIARVIKLDLATNVPTPQRIWASFYLRDRGLTIEHQTRTEWHGDRPKLISKRCLVRV